MQTIDLLHEISLLPKPKKSRKKKKDVEEEVPVHRGYFALYDPLKELDPVRVNLGNLSFQTTFIDTWDKFENFLSLLQTSKSKKVAFDTETIGLHGELAGLSFSLDGKIGFYIPVKHDFGVCLDADKVMAKLKPLFESPEYTWICWNAQYEMIILHKYFGVRIVRYHDGMLLAKELQGNLPMGLKHRSIIELNLQNTIDFKDIVPKDTTVNQHSIPLVGIYAAQDAILTYRTTRELFKDPTLKHIKYCYTTCELPVIPYFAEMTELGIEVIPEVLHRIKADYLEEIAKIETEMFYEASFNPETQTYDAYKDEDGQWQNLMVFNPQSTPEKRALFFERLKWPVVHRTPAGEPSLDGKKALPKYVAKGYKLAELLTQWSKLMKVVQTYTDGITLKLDKKNRVHPSYKQWGTTTGRASCADPNFMAMPAKPVKKGSPAVREAFVAREGYTFIDCDFSQLEMRVLAHFSDDPNMIKIFTSGIDMHAYNAAIIEGVFYGKPTTYEEFMERYNEEERLIAEKKITKAEAYYHQQRDKSKTVGFGLNYGAGPRDDLGITEEFIDAYYEAIPQAKVYKEAHRIVLEAHGYAIKLLGGRRYLPLVQTGNFGEREKAHRQGFSTHIQGSAGDLMKLSMIKIGQYRDEHKIPCYFVAQVHDELLLECHNDYLDIMVPKVKYFMENCYPLNVPLEAEPGTGKTWAEAK